MPCRTQGHRSAPPREKAGGRGRAEAERGPPVRFATYVNSVEQKIEMEMWALKDGGGSHLPPGPELMICHFFQGHQKLPPSRSHSKRRRAPGGLASLGRMGLLKRPPRRGVLRESLVKKAPIRPQHRVLAAAAVRAEEDAAAFLVVDPTVALTPCLGPDRCDNTDVYMSSRQPLNRLCINVPVDGCVRTST